MSFPATVFEFMETFPDEEACWRYLRRARWPRGFRCPRCEHRRSYRIEGRRLDQCVRCRYQASLTAGTVLHRSRVPLRVWFLAIFFVARHKQGISALQLQRDTGLGSYQTAWTLLHKVRSALTADPGRLLSGLVEADEAYVGAPHEQGRRGGRARGRKTLVGAVVERQGGPRAQLRLGVLASHTYANDLGPFVQGAIEAPRTTVRTDGLDGYRPLAEAGIGHERIVVGRSRARSVKLFPWSHAVFANLKSWLRGTFHGVSPKHLARYLDEFTYRFNERWREQELFDHVLGRALQAEPLPYHHLTAEAVG
jgi:transposase-like protein